jgi:hypothetical protein
MPPKLSADQPAYEDGGRARQQPSSDYTRELRRRMESRLTQLITVRLSWWTHWRELAAYILPRRYRWLVTPNQWNRGSPINQNIINSTGTLAARNAAAGIMSGTTSPSRPWFRMSVPDPEIMRDGDVQLWCEEVTERMMRVMAASNYYGAKAVQNLDLVVFGTAPLIIYEDNDTIIRCFNPAAGEYCAATGPNFDVDTLFREFTMTVDQVVREFGIENVSQTVRSLYDTPGSGRDTEVIVAHCIEPNPEYDARARRVGANGLPRHFRYREFYWERSGNADRFLRVAGFLDQPFSCPRWDVMGNDAYGRSPGMDALGDIKQLQQQEKRKAQGIDKQVNPPMVADASMRNEPASLLPGAVTYVPMLNGGVGFKPAFNVNLPIGELKDDIAKVEARIRDAFFNDLFLMISQLDTVRTATEIDARREEKLIMLGPAMDRLQREGLAADINRIFAIMARRGMLPPMPEAMQGAAVKVEYISLLSDLQRATATSGIERVWGFAGNIGAAVPSVLDNLDADATIEVYANLLRVSPKILASKQQKAQLRGARAEQEETAVAMQTGAEAVNAGKVLSETDVGGGQNALAMMLNGAG